MGSFIKSLAQRTVNIVEVDVIIVASPIGKNWKDVIFLKINKKGLSIYSSTFSLLSH